MDFPKSVPGAGLVGGVFVDENQATGQPGSLMAAAWGNAVTKELLSVIEDAELEPDEAKTDQLLEAIEILVARYAPPSVLPIFMQGFHGGSRASLAVVFAGMATPDDGLQLTALTHPEIVRRVLRGDVKTCTEAEYQADPYKRGMWSLGTASIDGDGKPQGWVRMPDRNGVLPGSLPAPFWRGGVDAKVGSIGKDTMRRLEGKVGAIGFNYRESVIDLEGVFELGTPAAAIASNGAGGQPGNTGFKFDSAKGLPAGHTGTEFAPWNITGVSYTITANGIVNEAALDAAGVMAQVLLLQGRATALEGRHKALGDGQVRINVKANRAANTVYTVPPGQAIKLNIVVIQGGGGGGELRINGVALQKVNNYNSVNSAFNYSEVLFPGETYEYAITAGAQTIDTWIEGRAA